MHQVKTRQAALVGKKRFPLQKQAFGGSLFFPAGTRFDLMAFWEFHFKKKASICSLF